MIPTLSVIGQPRQILSITIPTGMQCEAIIRDYNIDGMLEIAVHTRNKLIARR
jgi:hypothetical protein